MKRLTLIAIFLIFGLVACDALEDAAPLADDGDGETARVIRVTDGDTIRVEFPDGTTEDVRYIGINTPERDEPCYGRDGGATGANADFVEGQTVRLVQDITDRDRFGRLLRYIYVGDTFVNAELIRGGWAEATRYEPDTRHFDEFVDLERAAERANIGCHPTGIFDDGTFNR